MESRLIFPDGLIRMPMTFGWAGEHINQPLKGPAGISYGVEVRQELAIESGFEQWIGPRGTGKAAQQQDYFYTNEKGAMWCLNVPEDFALVFSDRVGYFRLAIFSMDETPHCVTALKITHDESMERLHFSLTYSIQREEVNPRDLITNKECQLVTYKVKPNQGKIIATSELGEKTFDHTLFQSDERCYAWYHNGQIKIFETCLSDEVLADLDIEESLRALEDNRNREKRYKAYYGL